jgi:hypothetical protein
VWSYKYIFKIRHVPVDLCEAAGQCVRVGSTDPGSEGQLEQGAHLSLLLHSDVIKIQTEITTDCHNSQGSLRPGHTPCGQGAQDPPSVGLSLGLFSLDHSSSRTRIARAVPPCKINHSTQNTITPFTLILMRIRST